MSRRIFLIFLFLVVALFAESALANSLPQPEKYGLPFEGQPVAENVGRIIKQAIMYVGVLAIMALTYGGILMMLSYGDESKLKSAKSVVSYALLGVVLAGGAYAIVEALNALKLV
jgi:hypothetical protein